MASGLDLKTWPEYMMRTHHPCMPKHEWTVLCLHDFSRHYWPMSGENVNAWTVQTWILQDLACRQKGMYGLPFFKACQEFLVIAKVPGSQIHVGPLQKKGYPLIIYQARMRIAEKQACQEESKAFHKKLMATTITSLEVDYLSFIRFFLI
jgi:hypothetical protein